MNHMALVGFQKLVPEAVVPTRATEGSAGYDLCVCENVHIPPGQTLAVPTGLALNIPEGYEGQIRSRSGLALRGIVVANQPGTIDSDYRGHVQVLLHSQHGGPTLLAAGTRVAQLIIAPVCKVNFVEADVKADTARGTGGFGSTGI